jgi:ribosomal protein L9
MLFIDNKYTRWYYTIINRAKSREISGYIEKHHILPKCLGGSNDHSNLVSLTAREHFICHLLLIKMTIGTHRRKLCYAAWQMTFINGRTKRDRYKPTSRIYEMLKQKMSETYKGVPKTKIHWLGKKHSEKTLQLQSQVKTGEKNPMYGKIQTDDTIKKIKEKLIGVPKPKFECPNCKKIIGAKGNLVRWHGDNCRINKR